jgi:hypothetical protein
MTTNLDPRCPTCGHPVIFASDHTPQAHRFVGIADSTYDTVALVAIVKQHAVDHYEEGWDVVVECYGDADLARTIGRARTVKGALAKFEAMVDVWNDRCADARNSAF